MTMPMDDETVREFLVESRENLDRLDRELVALEAEPTPERIAVIFRTIHTVKSTAGFLGFTRLETLAHCGEHLLSKLRDGGISLDAVIASTLLELVDRTRAYLASIDASGREGELDSTALNERLTQLARVSVASATAKPPAPVPVISPPLARLAPVVEPVVAPIAAPPVPIAAPPTPVASPRPSSVEPPSAGADAIRADLGDTTVRVDVALLDKLMNLVGELVLTRNQIQQLGVHRDHPAMTAASQRLDLITSELQGGVMKTRLQPIGNVWSKLPRVVRDVAVACRKQVRIEMIGKDTELDRTIIEAIKDPLIHLVRNAIDHGIETPDVREARGKPKTGTITLRASHEGGQVYVEISDDGAGIDVERVRAKALANGVATGERLAKMTERELCQLIFLPGFSTAAAVTNVSGRGVGMDVVRTNIERIGGSLDLQNDLGRGTSLKIKIPLTLAIVPALVVVVGGHRFAIPQGSLLELVRVDAASPRGIETIHGVPVFRLRDRLLPLVDLGSSLGIDRPACPDATVNIVVLQADARPFGLIVDEICDTEEIVVKPLGNELKALSMYAGATIMGDGRAALILDVFGIARHASAISGARVQRQAEVDGVDGSSASLDGATGALLVLEIGDQRTAIPLAVVDRLEQIDPARIEHVGNDRVLQYRGALLPLIDLGARGGGEAASVVVCRQHDHRVGLVVDSIVDIVAQAAPDRTRGVAAVVDGRVTELLDVSRLIASRRPAWLEEDPR